MGGQACVFYGAAEFSRDLDLIVLTAPENLDRLRAALVDLGAEPVAVPPFDFAYLQRGHALHFRCRREDVQGLRIDVMSHLRGVAPFDELWERRTTIEVDGDEIDMLGLADLVAAKKTQRSKDWPMIRRLLERRFLEPADAPEQAAFLLRELRTPELLIEETRSHPELARQIALKRPAVELALIGDRDAVESALEKEEGDERAIDRLYWEPLKRELEQLRRDKRTQR
jgi:hypothetical protein